MSAARIEGQAKRRGRPPRQPIEPGSFAALVEQFRTEHPDAWNECRTWPTESGLAFIAERLK